MASTETASRGLEVVITCVVFTALACVFVALRLVARVAFLKNGGPDEIAIVVSLLCSISLLVATMEQVNNGLGRHFETLRAEQYREVSKCLWISIVVYNLGLSLTKISIVLQYLRVFIGTRIRVACWATIGVIVAYATACVSTAIFTCVPVSGFWTGRGRCVDKQFLWFFNAAFNILTDVVVVALPMPVISSLKLPVKQKVGLMFIFACGGFVCIVSIMRLRALYIISRSTDVTWDNVEASIWSDIELNMGIICASLPTIKPVISRIFPRLLGSTRSRTGPENGPHRYYASNSHRHTYTFRSDALDSITPVRLADMDTSHKTVTKIEGGGPNGNGRDLEAGGDDWSGSEGGMNKEIFVVTSMHQDVERKMSDAGTGDIGSEKDLIIQPH